MTARHRQSDSIARDLVLDQAILGFILYQRRDFMLCQMFVTGTKLLSYFSIVLP